MKKNTIYQRIQTFSQGRDPERLQLKYKAMQEDSFSFLRGTNHLFYQDWPKESVLNSTPLTWICGDLHFENFSSYRGDNRLCYFDINDFDEAVLAPCTLDLARFLCSLLVGANALNIEQAQAVYLCNLFLDTYPDELLTGKARWIERSTTSGMIHDLLKSVKHRSRSKFIKSRTDTEKGQRFLKIDGEKTLLASKQEQSKVTALINQFASTQKKHKFFKVLDVARRISGNSSLGLERYVILIKGKGKKHHYLLDLKYQPGSSIAPYLMTPQPKWDSEAERVVQLQRRGQAISMAFLTPLTDGKHSYLLKELTPAQDRLKLSNWNGKFRRLEKVIKSMAELVAWQHIRTSGWHGSAINDQWQAFGQDTSWKQPLLEYSLMYSLQIQSDWIAFKEAFQANTTNPSDQKN